MLFAAAAFAQTRTGELTVAADGTGQFKTVQEAVDHAPSHAHERFVIHIKPGIYREPVRVPADKTFLTLRGDDAKSTVITFDRHAGLPGLNGKPIITFDTPTVFIQANDFTAENLTFENSSARQGQAVALTIMGDRGVFRNCRFLGFQDTLLAQAGRQYFDHCYVQGAIDFIFGGSAAYFDHCEIHVIANGYITAANTPQDQKYGYVFSHAIITGEPGVLTYLGRPWRAYAATVFLNTEMSTAVRPVGWNNWNDPAKEKTARYAEYGSSGPGGDKSTRVAWARQLSDGEAKTYSTENVLGGEDGWNPLTGEVKRRVTIVQGQERPATLRPDSTLLAATSSRLMRSDDGYRWTPAAGSFPSANTQNPSVTRSPEGVFYWLWSSGTRGDKAFSFSTSPDLVHWSEPQRVEIMAKLNALDVVSPRLFYDEAGRRYIVTWASTMAANSIQSFQEDVENNPRIWYSITEDFKSFSDPKLLFDPNYSVRDAVIVKVGDRYALIHDDVTTPVRSLRVAFADTPLGPWGPSRDAFTERNVENPIPVQLGGEWWIYAFNTARGEPEIVKTRDFWSFSEDEGFRTNLYRAQIFGVIEVPSAAAPRFTPIRE